MIKDKNRYVLMYNLFTFHKKAWQFVKVLIFRDISEVCVSNMSAEHSQEKSAKSSKLKRDCVKTVKYIKVPVQSGFL